MIPFVFERLGKKDTASVIIVSPLVALIEAQCEKLRSKGLSASQLSKDSKTTELGKCQYIFASPEMLLEVRRETLLSSDIQQNVVAVFVDEGHCIIKWGKDDPKTKKEAFRGHYSRIGEIRSLLPVPMVVMTATATPAAKKEMIKLVGLTEFLEISLSPNRENINYSVIKIPQYDLYTVFKSTLDDIEKNGILAQRVIVYCRKKEQCCELFELFRTSLGSKGYVNNEIGDDRTRMYAMFHSKTSQPVKDSVLESFLDPSGHVRIVFCTVAFGMGIDVKGVNNVIHIGPSNSLEDYLQESGRVGRNGQKSYALMITYPHATSGNVNSDMKMYCKADTCRRRLLLNKFGFDKGSDDSHSCCDVCRSECNCGICGFDRDSNEYVSRTEASITCILRGLSSVGLPIVHSTTSEQRLSIHERLMSYRNELAGDHDLFHGIDISTGFTRELVDTIVQNVDCISSPDDLKNSFNFLDSEHVFETWDIICEVLEDLSDNVRLNSSSESDSDSDPPIRRYRRRPNVLDSSDSE